MVNFSIHGLTHEQMNACQKVIGVGDHMDVVSTPVHGQLNNTVDVQQNAPHNIDHNPVTGEVIQNAGVTPDVQTVPVQQPVPTGGNEAEFDSTGTPHDDRIHSVPAKQTKKGVWQRRRNTPDETFNAVMAELKGAPPFQAQQPVQQHQPVIQNPPPMMTNVVHGQPLPDPNGLTQPHPIIGTNLVHEQQPVQQAGYPELMQAVANATQVGTFDQAGVSNVCTLLGVTDLQQIANAPDQITYAITLITDPNAMAQAIETYNATIVQ